MNSAKIFIWCLVGISLFSSQHSLADGPQQAAVYDGTLTNIGVMGGYASSFALGINDAGVVVGEGYGPGLSPQAFLYDGSVHEIGTLGGSYSVAFDINNSGVVTGTSSNASGRQRAFLYDGIFHELPTLGDRSLAFSINSVGQVAGLSEVGGMEHAFIYDNRNHNLMDLGALLSQSSEARAINDAGNVVGFYGSDNSGVQAHGFYYNGTVNAITPLPGFNTSAAFGINNEAQVVGGMSNNFSDYHAYLYAHGITNDLNNFIDPSSGWVLEVAESINDNGQIAGMGIHSGQTHGFILTPHNNMYSVTDIGTFPGGLFSDAVDLNNFGVAVGNSTIPIAEVPELSTCLGYGSLLAFSSVALFRQRKKARKAS